jgi:anti-sigma-K factor RskA
VVTHPSDELAAYSIGALEDDAAAAVAAHLRTCAACRADVEAYEQTAWRLAESVAAEPPAHMRAAVVERAHADRPVRPRSGLAAVIDLFRRPIPAFVPVALALAVVVAVAGYAGARRDAERYAGALVGVQNARVVALAPSAERPAARGALVLPSNGTLPYLILDLPAAPSGKTWQAWVIRGESPLPAGISGDVEVIFLTVPLQPGDVVAVTLEAAGGASKPTSAPVLTGKSS